LTSPEAFLSGAISGAKVTNELSFSANRIDLPGSWLDSLSCVFNTPLGLFVGGKERDMQLIKDLAISYIQKPSCIILLTVACESTFCFELEAFF
jgi:hypothetical protein